jgi:hypothetical protein
MLTLMLMHQTAAAQGIAQAVVAINTSAPSTCSFTRHAGDGSRVWSYQFGLAGNEEPLGRQQLHVNKVTGDIFLVTTNDLKGNTITAVKIVPPTSTTLASHTPLDIDFAPLTTTTPSRQVRALSVVLSVDAASGSGGLWIAGSSEGCPAAVAAAGQTCPGGSADGFILQVSAPSLVTPDCDGSCCCDHLATLLLALVPACCCQLVLGYSPPRAWHFKSSPTLWSKIRSDVPAVGSEGCTGECPGLAWLACMLGAATSSQLTDWLAASHWPQCGISTCQTLSPAGVLSLWLANIVT